MRTTHRMLLRIWHDPDCDFSKVKIGYRSRGAPGNCSNISGPDVVKLDNRYIVLQRKTKFDEEMYIPYHRILWIRYDQEVIWSQISL